jgi:hypothetical protein
VKKSPKLALPFLSRFLDLTKFPAQVTKLNSSLTNEPHESNLNLEFNATEPKNLRAAEEDSPSET